MHGKTSMCRRISFFVLIGKSWFFEFLALLVLEHGYDRPRVIWNE